MTAVRLHGAEDLRVEEVSHPGSPGTGRHCSWCQNTGYLKVILSVITGYNQGENYEHLAFGKKGDHT